MVTQGCPSPTAVRPLLQFGGYLLSLIQMILLTHLKAGFGKRAYCRCDCVGYRPDILAGGWSVEITSDAFLAIIRAESE